MLKNSYSAKESKSVFIFWIILVAVEFMAILWFFQ
jgi:hypothetical protein